MLTDAYLSKEPVFTYELTIRLNSSAVIDALTTRLNALLQGKDYLAIGADFRSFIHVDDIPAFTSYTQQALSGAQEAPDCELRLLHHDGSTAWYVMHLARYTNGANEPALAGYLFDITRLKEAQERLSRELGTRAAFENALPGGIEMSNEHGMKVYVNKAFCIMTGFSEAELIGEMPPYSYWPPEEHDRILDRFNRANLQHGPGKFEFTFMRKNGERFPVRLFASPVYDGPRRTGILATFYDITEERAFESRLNRSEDRFRSLFESISGAILFLDSEGTVLEANAAARELLGITPQDIQHLRLPCEACHLISNQGRKISLPEYPHLKAIRNSKKIKPQLYGIRKGDKTLWARIKAIPLPDPLGGNTQCAFLELEDATAEVEAVATAAHAREIIETLAASTADLISVFDTEGYELFRSQGLPDVFASYYLELSGKPKLLESTTNPLYRVFRKCLDDRAGSIQAFIQHQPGAPAAYYECRGEVLMENTYYPKHIVLITREITSRVETDRKNKDTERMLKLLFDQSREGMFLMKCFPAMRITLHNPLQLQELYNTLQMSEWNSAVSKLCHVEPDSFQGASAGDMFRKFSQKPEQLFYDLVERGSLQVTATITRSDDSLVTAQVELILVTNNEGEVEGLCGVVRDISDSEQMFAALAESELKFRTIAENIPEILFQTDSTSKVLYLSPSIQQITGYTPEYFTGTTFTAMLAAGTKQSALRRFKADLQGRDAVTNFSIELQHSSGHRVAAEVSAIVLWKDGRPSGTIGIIRDVSKQKQQEQELTSLKNFYEEILDVMPMQIAVMDTRMKHLYVNPAAIRNQELRKFIIGKDIVEYFQYRKHDIRIALERMQSIQKILSTKLPHSYEEQMATSKGNQSYLRYAIPVLDTAGEVKSLVHVGLDITLMKEMERELKKREVRFRELFTQMPDGFCLLDIVRSKEGIAEDFIMVEYNSRFAQMLGIEDTAGIGARTSRLLAQFEPAWFTFLKDVADSSVTRRTEGFSSIRGRYFSLLTYITEGGKLALLLRDTTQERIQKEKIYQLSTVVEQSPVSILIINASGVIIYVNNYYCTSNNTQLADLLGARIDTLLEKKINADMLSTIRTAREQHHMWSGELQFTEHNGDISWASVILMPMALSETAPVNFVWIQSDITERKLMLQDLTAAKNRAEEMNRLKSSFLANMSHELRTPLIGILGFSEILAESIQDQELGSMADTINISGQRLLTTLNQILDLSRVEANQQDLATSKQDVAAIIREILELFSSQAAAKGLRLVHEIASPAFVQETDERLLRSILSNLVHNAIKFTKQGSVTVRLNATAGSGDMFSIDVQDTGIGITEDQREVIFEEFRQASEGFGRAYEGTGLGLTIARKFAAMLGGSLHVESTAGKGSTFTLFHPIA